MYKRNTNAQLMKHVARFHSGAISKGALVNGIWQAPVAVLHDWYLVGSTTPNTASRGEHWVHLSLSEDSISYRIGRIEAAKPGWKGCHYIKRVWKKAGKNTKL